MTIYYSILLLERGNYLNMSLFPCERPLSKLPIAFDGFTCRSEFVDQIACQGWDKEAKSLTHRDALIAKFSAMSEKNICESSAGLHMHFSWNFDRTSTRFWPSPQWILWLFCSCIVINKTNYRHASRELFFFPIKSSFRTRVFEFHSCCFPAICR